MKHCPKCKTDKPLDEFHNKTASKDGKASWCKPCNVARNRPYSAEYHRNNKLKKAYGSTLEDYEAMFNAQGRACMICKTVTDPTGREMAVDHCHTSGIIRGILCSNCNRALGLLQDSEAILSAAIEYLRR